MNMSQTNQAKPSAQSTPNQPVNLSCTQKCRDAIAADTEITGRTRQYCMLLTRDDNLSQKACARMSAKINLSKLIDAGYIQTGQESEQKSQPLKSSQQKRAISPANNTHSRFDNKSPKPSARSARNDKSATKLAISTQRVKPLRRVSGQVSSSAKSNSLPVQSISASTVSPMLQFAAGKF